MRRGRRRATGAAVVWGTVAAAATGCLAAAPPEAGPNPERRFATTDAHEGHGGGEGGRGAEVADPDWVLRTRTAEEVRLGELRGRPVVINLWATWCPPCIEELDSLERLAVRVRDTRVAFLLVTAEEPDQVEAFLARNPVALPVLFEETLAPEAFGPVVLPTTVVLDARGRIALRHRGATVWDTDEVERLLRALDREASR